MPVTRRAFSCRSLALAALLPLGLSACAQSEASVSPFSEPERADGSALGRDPRLLVMTTRRSTGNVAPYFDTDRGRLTFAEARLSPPGRGIAGRVSSAVSGDWAVLGIARETTDGAAGAFAAAANGQDVLLYIHGFNETFDTAARSAGQLSHALAFQGRTALFTWPSGGRLFDYAYDRESALWSRDGFVQTLQALIANPTVGRIHIVAHSMGTFLTLEGLRELRDSPEIQARIGSVVLASPDVDIDAFEQTVRKLGPLAHRMTVIIDPGDRALAVSARIAGGVARAGSADRTRLEALGVRVADTSGRGWSMLRHDLFLSNSEVTQVVRRAMERGGG
ncbi:alpha/beta fold hydrolase [Bosea sp. (in: a-proteobacteria)]|uniref:alpha/beta hydrolase n=1 Tax=Bosea sp. (in: a-proteobacteria) TaxID=1871050 RepID=UPI002629BCAC|nr:alpha/beta fold hydrolase [Bosea sp. (in: a-proteobacteria)]MCO5092521.1 alpha/beta hydrolase [Bosea sp. (in: a-proteobacteria)]